MTHGGTRTESTTDVIDAREIRAHLRAMGEHPELGDEDDEGMGDVLARDTHPPPAPASAP